MIDISLSPEHTLTGIILLAQLVLISIWIRKFHRELEKIRILRSRLRLKQMDNNQYREALTNINTKIRLQKRSSTLQLVFVGISHLSVSFCMDYTLFLPLIILTLCVLTLRINFWLKGSGITSDLNNLPSTSDYRM